HGHVPAGVIQRSHDVRSDKTGTPGHQQHAIPCQGYSANLCPTPARQATQSVFKRGGVRFAPGKRVKPKGYDLGFDFIGTRVVRVLKDRWPNRPVDLLVTSLCTPLVDYMPGVRAGIVWDLPRGRLAVAKQWGLATELRARGYGTAFVLPRTWKAAIAPALAGI